MTCQKWRKIKFVQIENNSLGGQASRIFMGENCCGVMMTSPTIIMIMMTMAWVVQRADCSSKRVDPSCENFCSGKKLIPASGLKRLIPSLQHLSKVQLKVWLDTQKLSWRMKLTLCTSNIIHNHFQKLDAHHCNICIVPSTTNHHH